MQHSPQRSTPCRILIAEDHVLLLDSFTVYLRYRGYEVYPASNGAVALEIMERCSREGTPVHLLITDIEMPVINGAELIAMVRAADEQFPILAMTNSIEPDDVRRLAKFTGIAFLDKPFRLPALLKHVEQLLNVGESGGGGVTGRQQVINGLHTNRRPNEKNQ